MLVKIDVINNKFCKLSPYAFGTMFTNINECTTDINAEKTFANVGIHKGKVIQDCNGVNYQIANLSVIPSTSSEIVYKVDLKELSN